MALQLKTNHCIKTQYVPGKPFHIFLVNSAPRWYPLHSWLPVLPTMSYFYKTPLQVCNKSVTVNCNIMLLLFNMINYHSHKVIILDTGWFTHVFHLHTKSAAFMLHSPKQILHMRTICHAVSKCKGCWVHLMFSISICNFIMHCHCSVIYHCFIVMIRQEAHIILKKSFTILKNWCVHIFKLFRLLQTFLQFMSVKFRSKSWKQKSGSQPTVMYKVHTQHINMANQKDDKFNSEHIFRLIYT